MKYIIRNLIVTVRPNVDLKVELSKHLNINKEDILSYIILRQSLDARKKNNLRWLYSLLIESKDKIINKNCVEYKAKKEDKIKEIKLNNENPIIIGAGPSGLFCALELVERGFKPIIFDRGKNIEERKEDVSKFWDKSILDENSNVQFGEGGAGAFSDGKLTARTQNIYSEKVFSYLLNFGADKEIVYQALPHLGSNGIQKITKKIREYILSKGGEFRWNSKLEDLVLENNKIKKIVINGVDYFPEILILAIGNSARDTYKMLFTKKIHIESKPFAVGVRIEHLQEYVNEKFYGKHAPISLVGPATYRITDNYKGHSIYSFCMCPGGFVIGSSSLKDHISINGMSFLARNNRFANSAIVCSVDKSNYGQHPLAGMEMQALIEEKAFNLSQSYLAPFQSGSDFLKGKISKRRFQSSFKPHVFPAQIKEIFTKKVGEYLYEGLLSINKRYKGFVENGILIAPETRTSSPIRIVRNNFDMSSISAENLFPIGEGSGYAGGIISSAVDGLKLASRFII